MFCSKCGNQFVTQVKFCSKCGQPTNISSSEAQVQNSVRWGTLTITRAKQWFAINPAVRVILDGSAEYEIDNGSTLNIPISIGTHNIAFSCGMRNKIVNVNVVENVTLNIKWNRITGSLEVK